MSDSLFSKRYFYPVAGGIFCLVMACVPTILELAGLGGGGIAQLDMLNKIGIYAALALSLNLILGQTACSTWGIRPFSPWERIRPRSSTPCTTGPSSPPCP